MAKHYESLRDVCKVPKPSATWQARILAEARAMGSEAGVPWYGSWHSMLRWQRRWLVPELCAIGALALLLFVWQPNYRSYIPGLNAGPQPQVVERAIESPIIEWETYFEAMGVFGDDIGVDLSVPVGAGYDLRYRDEPQNLR